MQSLTATDCAGKPKDIVWGNFRLPISERCCVMGILNSTPDSFSDGGRYLEHQAAVNRALAMVREGADIIDVGGESTRPGAKVVDIALETSRTAPLIKEIRQRTDCVISIDTRKSRVAEQALKNGASMVNDISGLKHDPELAKVVRDYDVPVVIMHIKGTPRTMQDDPSYDNLIEEIKRGFGESLEIAGRAGIDESKIILDPGIGFGKTSLHNLEILKRLGEFKNLGRPLLVGTSRKSFIKNTLSGAGIEDERIESSGRLSGTLASCAIAIMEGADLIRVHDVKESVEASRVADAIKRV